MTENKETVQEVEGQFTCKVCGGKSYKTEKTEQERLDKQMCSSCYGDLTYQRDRVNSAVKRVEDVFEKITFPEVKVSLIEQVAKVLKSQQKK